MRCVVEQECLECFVVGLLFLFSLDGHVVKGDGFDKAAQQVVSWHFSAFLVDDLEIKRGQLQSVVGLCVHLSHCLESFVVSEQHEVFSHQEGSKVLHGPVSSIHLERVRHVVLLVGVEALSGIGDGPEPSLIVLLG